MKITLPYGKGSIGVDIPENQLGAVVEPNTVPLSDDPKQAVLNAIANESDGDFAGFLKSDGPLLVIVNDATRPTPTATVLETLSAEIDDPETRFIVATGAHRAPAEEELTFIFGTTLNRFRDRILFHDAKKDEMFTLGVTSRGTEVRFNKAVEKAGRILIIGSVEPHFFAGYTGGRKGLLPGVAAYDTIEKNHKMALEPEAKLLALKGNPVHEDMMEACGMLDKKLFTVMTVLDRNHELYAVTAGGLDEALQNATEKADDIFVVPIEDKADVVIACSKYPMDIDLYQSQKSIEHGRLALKPGGTLILVSACRTGIGGEIFYNLLSSSRTPGEVFRKIEAGYRLGYHKAAKIAALCEESKIAAFSDLDPELLQAIFIEPVSDLQHCLDRLLADPEKRIVLMPDASVTVPVVRKP